MGCGNSSTSKEEAFRNPGENNSHQTHNNSVPKPTEEATRPEPVLSKASQISRSQSSSSKSKDTQNGKNSADHQNRNNTVVANTTEHNNELNDTAVETNEEDKSRHSCVNTNTIENNNEPDNTKVENNHTVQQGKAQAETDDVVIKNEIDKEDGIGKQCLDSRVNTEGTVNQTNEKNETKDVDMSFDNNEQVISDDEMAPLDIPEVDKTREMKTYTVDDMNANKKRLLKYGRNVYSYDIVQPIIKDTPRDEYLQRMKQEVEKIIEPYEVEKKDLSDDEDEDEENKTESEYGADYIQQLVRWLQKYPNVETANKPAGVTDLNDAHFPIANEDPSAFHKWGEWEPFDMTIDGEAGWNVIESDLLKKDSTTEDQDKTLALRQKRKNINDPKWMAKRRRELAEAFKRRHNKRYRKIDPKRKCGDTTWESETMPNYLGFADRLENEWKRFQEVSNSPFNPPDKYRKLYASRAKK